MKSIFGGEVGIKNKVYSLIWGKGERIATDGIEMHEWSPHSDKELSIVRLWDFAGQEIFYTTHQFFLSQNSITFLLFNLKDSIEESKIEFWLNSIQYRAPKSKVMIIGTHLDLLDSKLAEEEIKLKSEKIREIYSQILLQMKEENEDKIELIECKQWRISKKGKIINETILFFPISGINNIGIDEIKTKLRGMTSSTIVTKEIINLSKQILSLREKLDTPVDKKKKKTFNISTNDKNESEINKNSNLPLMGEEEFDKLMEENKIIGKEEKKQTRKILKELGFILDFSEWELKKIIYNPQWLSDLFLCVISLKNQEKLMNEGSIEKKEIEKNLINKFKNIRDDEIKFLIELLEKFEIFIIDPQNKEKLVIPFLMGSKKPEIIIQKWNNFYEENNNYKLGRSYEFPFLPSGIMSKIIYGFHHPSLKNLSFSLKFWKNGILITWKKCHVLLELIEKSSKSQIIKIICVGDKTYKSVLENVCFIIEEVMRKEYPLLFEKGEQIIHYFKYKQEFNISLKECLEKLKKKEDTMKLSNDVYISREDIFDDKSSSTLLQIDYDTLQLIKGSKIGSGSYGKVFKCKFEGLNGTFAIKEFDEIKSKQSFEQEREILKEIKNHRIITLLGSKKDKTNLYLIFEYYDLSLKELLLKENWKKFFNNNEEIKLNLCYQVCEGIEHLHSKNIVHLDIKGGNILVEIRNTSYERDEYDLKIADFGTSRKLGNENETLSLYIGTLSYMSPEVKLNQYSQNPYNPFLSDIYSMGCVFFDIMLGYGKRMKELENINFEENNWILNKCRECCCEDPNKRPTCKQLKEYFQSNSNSIFLNFNFIIY